MKTLLMLIHLIAMGLVGCGGNPPQPSLHLGTAVEVPLRAVETPSLRNAAASPAEGKMKLVIDCSNVNRNIRIRVRVALKKGLIAAGLAEEAQVDEKSLSCDVPPGGGVGDLDDLWLKVSEILGEVLGEGVVTDAWAKMRGTTLTVTICPNMNNL